MRRIGRLLIGLLLLTGCARIDDTTAVAETTPHQPEEAPTLSYIEKNTGVEMMEVEGEAVSPNGRYQVLLTETAFEDRYAPQNVIVWDTAEHLIKWQDTGYLDQSARWSFDGRYLALAQSARTYERVTIIETENWTEWEFTLPDGSAIPEYTFLPEEWGDWLDPNTLLLTVGRGGDAGEQHTYRCSLEIQNEALTAAGVLEQTTETLEAEYDFTHDGNIDVLERITVLDPDTGEDLWHELWLRNGTGERIWSYTMSAGGPSWDTSLFTLEVEGQDCFLELVTAMGQGNCAYFYEVFSLSETGERVSIERSEVQFDVNFGSPIHESFDCASIADFLWRIKELTACSDSLLMDIDVADGLRCHAPAAVFTHDYHCGECVALDSREAIEDALELYRLEREQEAAIT